MVLADDDLLPSLAVRLEEGRRSTDSCRRPPPHLATRPGRRPSPLLGPPVLQTRRPRRV